MTNWYKALGSALTTRSVHIICAFVPRGKSLLSVLQCTYKYLLSEF